jgi:anti-anti-sigma factor
MTLQQSQSTANPSWIDVDHHLRIEIDDHAYPTRVALAGDLDLAGGDRLEVAVRPYVQDGARLEVEVHLLSFVDSSGLAALIDLAQVMHDRGGHLVLVDPAPQLLHLLDLTRTRDQFSISSAPARIAMHLHRAG